MLNLKSYNINENIPRSLLKNHLFKRQNFLAKLTLMLGK